MQTILFEPDITIPHSDLILFKACNQASSRWYNKKAFYMLKNAILEKYGTSAGYDLQVIDYACHSCDGTGWYYDVRCRSCNNGIYETVLVALQRWVLNGELFHKPIGRVNAEGKVFESDLSLKFESTIKGFIKHIESEINPNYAYICLLSKYDYAGYVQHLRSFRKSLKRDEFKLWGELSRECSNIFEQFSRWYKVEITDDLPF